MRPVTGENGSQRSDTKPSAVQAGSRAAWTARAVHSRDAAFVREFGLFEIGHQQRDPLRGLREERRHRARAVAEFARIDRGARQRQRALDIVGRERRKFLHAREPVARGIAEAQIGIGLRKIGMRRRLPGALQHARRLADFASPPRDSAPTARPPGTRSGASFTASNTSALRRVAVVVFERKRARGQQHRALPLVGRALQRAGRAIAFQHVERADPVAGRAAKLQHRLPGPRQGRRDLRRLLGIEGSPWQGRCCAAPR